MCSIAKLVWTVVDRSAYYLFMHFISQCIISRSSKVSKDSDCSLVSSKNFSELLPSNSWSPGEGKVGQGGLKVLHL